MGSNPVGNVSVTPKVLILLDFWRFPFDTLKTFLLIFANKIRFKTYNQWQLILHNELKSDHKNQVCNKIFNTPNICSGSSTSLGVFLSLSMKGIPSFIRERRHTKRAEDTEKNAARTELHSSYTNEKNKIIIGLTSDTV